MFAGGDQPQIDELFIIGGGKEIAMSGDGPNSWHTNLVCGNRECDEGGKHLIGRRYLLVNVFPAGKHGPPELAVEQPLRVRVGPNTVGAAAMQEMEVMPDCRNIRRRV